MKKSGFPYQSPTISPGNPYASNLWMCCGRGYFLLRFLFMELADYASWQRGWALVGLIF
jgi:hypothetical protein